MWALVAVVVVAQATALWFIFSEGVAWTTALLIAGLVSLAAFGLSRRLPATLDPLDPGVTAKAPRSEILKESVPLLALKALLHMFAVWLFLRGLASGPAIVAALVGVVLATVLATRTRRRLRFGAALSISLLGLAGAWLISEWLLDSTGLWAGLPPQPTLYGADMAFFGLWAFSTLFFLRDLSGRTRLGSMLEAGFVVGAVAYLFAAHRGLTLDQPRFFSDWAWSTGRDPQVILRGVGALAAGLSVLMLLEAQRLTKILLSLLTLLILGGAVYALIKDLRIEPKIDTGGVGLTGQEKKDKEKKDKENKGKGDGSGGGDNNDGLSGGSPPTPDPVAVAVFHATYDPPNGILYFRQQVLSLFDGNHLIADPERRYDLDVITEFPQGDALKAAPTQAADFHTQVPTSMYLLVDHPQPLALSASAEITPKVNPDPRRFVAAYGVSSLVANMPLGRLVGRASIPGDWTAEQQAHYLATPDDPRYLALAEEILRDVDPRFMSDDLMKALIIKRYLETNGYYTRKKTYNNVEDPTAEFLFGDMHGYCVHFAHSAAQLFRSVGIASRVAIGYAVDMRLQGGGSTVLILADRAHAWPEIHVEGVGWVTFDIYPEQSDEQPQVIVSRSLESMLGELAREDHTAGRAEDPNTRAWEIPWVTLGWTLLLTLLGLVTLAYAIKIGRRLAARSSERFAFAATLDVLGDLGERRHDGETRERFAERLAELVPSLAVLTRAHLRSALGRGADADVWALRRQVHHELQVKLPWWKRALAALNPFGWLWTR